jgi:hypothetical protein
MTLAEFVDFHTLVCLPGVAPSPLHPWVDIPHFVVSVRGQPDVHIFEKLTRKWPSQWEEVSPLDGHNYHYEHLGGWLGDENLALRFMALGLYLGVFVVVQVPTGPRSLSAGPEPLGRAVHERKWKPSAQRHDCLFGVRAVPRSERARAGSGGDL